ncbi:GNAT family N-acetyltransferase [Massilia niastensis]|uniref:GNAT family N-acetyltransferase n=1 Tax=Massilia niastensis TaxID=544911 RepID=UPI00035C24BE|nr:GNAT family N-acetyltransferase [Massilia niastensis]
MSWHTVSAARFPEFAARWQQLHARGPAPAMLAADFVAPLLAQFGAGSELLAWCERGGETVAMALVKPDGRGAWTTFQPSQAPLGLWLQLPGEPLEPLLAGLLRALPGFPLLFGLTQADPMLTPRPADSPGLHTLDYIDTARVTLAGGFEDYWNARGKNLRSNLKKQRARLEREGVATRLDILRAPQDMAQAIQDYGRLESSGWKGSEGTAVDAGNAQGRYYRAMLEALAARGAASVYRYFFGEQLVAMDLCVEDADSIVVLKTSYDESVPSSLSPTLLMREEACRRLFDEGRFKRLEFYGRVMEWHLRWTDEVRTMYHINYYRWPGLRRLRAMLASRGKSRSAAQ